jgi:site-specific DNA recombinase
MAKAARPVRCAIYTRKSTEEGLDKEFTSLDAQRDAARAYVKSQATGGWTCLPTRYDDGGFTGGNMDRPALKRLLVDIEAGKVDCVVVYKVDRLSRSLLDFARMMETFENHQVAFVSVTQQFNTASSMGRLVLNVLLSFAQFEREIISERTRDKIAAARRKGKWVGGHPLLGYDVDPVTFKLVVNESEAARVRAIFALYRKLGGLVQTVQELDRRGWVTKRWQTRKGPERGGKPFTKSSLHHLLTNVVYLGKVKYKREVHPGEHQAIVDASVWQEVQDLLGRRTSASRHRHGSAALLKGLLYCRPCGRSMTPTYACKNGGRRYGYYVCTNAVQRGHKTCLSGSLPNTAIEQWVIEQARHFALQSISPGRGGPADPFVKWESLAVHEQASLLRTWVARVDYDGALGKAGVTFHPSEHRPNGPPNGERG